MSAQPTLGEMLLGIEVGATACAAQRRSEPASAQAQIGQDEKHEGDHDSPQDDGLDYSGDFPVGDGGRTSLGG